ncbi:Ubiquitin associated and SH3 domain-containing protein B [Oopsacas minuta]|uniref:Ubiquitin associated and SH3 domain-containing protein B n=1 Tax=Oopsacas minuta TaxID=111878 RepID=A0AAV7K472_9METZ|nr:Ubiquitin associated and SH3 domain-containing protein B [Oopsacas minuta]
MAMNGSATIRQAYNSLQELMKMGISKQRSEKAIAATGDVGVEDAATWILNHLNDQDLEKVKHREYVVYLVPTGPLLSELNSFMASSIEQCGRNGAHKTFPHTTLCKFFTVSLH